jgi:hypothetical protein
MDFYYFGALDEPHESVSRKHLRDMFLLPRGEKSNSYRPQTSLDTSHSLLRRYFPVEHHDAIKQNDHRNIVPSEQYEKKLSDSQLPPGVHFPSKDLFANENKIRYNPSKHLLKAALKLHLDGGPETIHDDIVYVCFNYLNCDCTQILLSSFSHISVMVLHFRI